MLGSIWDHCRLMELWTVVLSQLELNEQLVLMYNCVFLCYIYVYMGPTAILQISPRGRRP